MKESTASRNFKSRGATIAYNPSTWLDARIACAPQRQISATRVLRPTGHRHAVQRSFVQRPRRGPVTTIRRKCCIDPATSPITPA